MPPPKRMTANPARPARWRAGKPAGQESASSSAESDGSDAEAPAVPPPPKARSAGKLASGLAKVDLDARRKEAAEEEERRRAEAERAERLAAEQGFVTEDDQGEQDDESQEEEEEESGSSEGEGGSSSSEEEQEAPRRLMMRPKFVPKSRRGKEALDEEQSAQAARLADEAARQKAADELVEEQIKRDLAARAAGKKHWDDDENPDSDVDTADGLDPAAEEAAWRVRELKRLKRARLAIEERERELAEVERRRNLTEEERRAEDEAHLARQREEKEGRGRMSFMQKYYHKGAFFQEEAEAAGLLRRDIMGTRIADDVRNREALPEYLQRRDMTRLGKKGATKYRDMRSEDTGRWGEFHDSRAGKLGGDGRFRPDDERFKPDERDAKGANAIPLGDKERRRDDGRGDNYRPRDGPRSRSRSRSRSPTRKDNMRRKRSTSGRAFDGDKRRRVDDR
ncbi:microfibril-associated protein [Metarhizium album ARSEF 1941]|uniref:Microfibril-associated protein n=1 Tax=Metarhizium album (strain ARSEF 1941) TaxID=1081103 RepID=A0A0B2X849_METAS|nr:microfibril-associated protein [Metarhizium album ARSEF 1941]KHO01476.1 microfibril-associated protein [Metarhizium album ARSEF 1941]